MVDRTRLWSESHSALWYLLMLQASVQWHCFTITKLGWCYCFDPGWHHDFFLWALPGNSELVTLSLSRLRSSSRRWSFSFILSTPKRRGILPRISHHPELLIHTHEKHDSFHGSSCPDKFLQIFIERFSHRWVGPLGRSICRFYQDDSCAVQSFREKILYRMYCDLCVCTATCMYVLWPVCMYCDLHVCTRDWRFMIWVISWSHSTVFCLAAFAGCC